MPRQSKRNWARTGILITLFMGSLAIAYSIISSAWDMRDKIQGLSVLLLIVYIAYNETTKEHAK